MGGAKVNWNSASDFFAMGGYGLYVWCSYGAIALWMLAEPLSARARHRAAVNQIIEENSKEMLDETSS